MERRDLLCTKNELRGRTCAGVWAGDAEYECAETDGERQTALTVALCLSVRTKGQVPDSQVHRCHFHVAAARVLPGHSPNPTDTPHSHGMLPDWVLLGWRAYKTIKYTRQGHSVKRGKILTILCLFKSLPKGIFTDFREEGQERDRQTDNDVRQKHRSVASGVHSDRGSNPQPFGVRRMLQRTGPLPTRAKKSECLTRLISCCTDHRRLRWKGCKGWEIGK